MALEIEYERPDKQREYRLTAPLFVTFNKKQYRAADWSLGGLRLEEITSKLPAVGDVVKVEIILPFQGFRIAFDGELEIVRHSKDGEGFGAKWLNLGERETELLNHFIDEIVRGTMSDVKETIARMDVPLTPVSIEPTPQPKTGKPPLHPWATKTYVVPALYGLAGLLVFGYAAFVAYANYFHLMVETAVVGGRVGVVKARSDGEIIYRGIEIGQVVKIGEIIALIKDPVLEARIQKTNIEIKRKQAQLVLSRQESEEYGVLQGGVLKNRGAEVRNLGRQLRQANAKHRRLLRLLKRRRTKRKVVDNARSYVLKLRTRLAKAKSMLWKRRQLLKQKSGKAVGDGASGSDQLSVHQARLNFLSSEVELAREDRKILLRQREQRVIKAPYDSRIIDLPKYANSTIIRGDVLVVLEPTGTNSVTAYLTQEEILKVKVGDTASVFVPALDRSLKARIKSINRRFSFVNEKDERYTWRPKEQRNAEVILEISSAEMEKGSRLTTGLPAIIMFRDRRSNTALSYIIPGFFKSDT